MKKNLSTLNLKLAVAAMAVVSTGAVLFSTGNAFANNYGTNITISDGITPNGTGVGNEDNEVEPKMAKAQAWDLEGFFLNGKTLTIIGGFNFYDGQNDGTGKILTAGDIFIDLDGDAVYSPNTISAPGFSYNPGYKSVSNSLFEYDYVLDIDWANGLFDIVQLDDNSVLTDTEHGAAWNTPSNPWKFDTIGTVIANDKSFNTYNQTSQNDTGFSNWNNWMGSGSSNHYVASFDLTGIDLSNGAVFHNTMECGNDNLIGKSAPVPEPATMLLMGTGLTGLAAVRRKKRA